jgi:hypothetical protein
VQFRFGLLGPLSIIHDGQAALMTSANQRIALVAPPLSANQAVSAEASCWLTTAFVPARTRVRRRSLRTSRETPPLPQVDG